MNYVQPEMEIVEFDEVIYTNRIPGPSENTGNTDFPGDESTDLDL